MTGSTSASPGPEDRLRSQHEALDKLFGCGWTLRAVAAAVGVSTTTVFRWKTRNDPASPNLHSKLIAAATSAHQEVNDWQGRRLGIINEKLTQRRDAASQQCGLWPPAERAITLQGIMHEHRVKRSKLAAMIGISYSTLVKYLDPNYDGSIAYPVAKRIQSLREGEVDEQDKRGLDERYRVAAQRLFGRYYDSGFAPYDYRNASAVRRLSALTGLTERTIYRHLPPYESNLKLSPKIVEAFELAARKLANLV